MVIGWTHIHALVCFSLHYSTMNILTLIDVLFLNESFYFRGGITNNKVNSVSVQLEIGIFIAVC